MVARRGEDRLCRRGYRSRPRYLRDGRRWLKHPPADPQPRPRNHMHSLTRTPRALRPTLCPLRFALPALCALLLSACSGASPASPADFIQQHTKCPSTNFLDPIWLPDSSAIIYTSAGPQFEVRQVNPDGSADHLLASGAVLP